MRYAITNFFSLSPENVSEDVFWALGAIYGLLVIVSLMSVVSKSASVGSALLWFILVLFVPVVGIAAHCVRCLFSADYGFLKQFGIGASVSKTSIAFSKS